VLCLALGLLTALSGLIALLAALTGPRLVLLPGLLTAAALLLAGLVGVALVLLAGIVLIRLLLVRIVHRYSFGDGPLPGQAHAGK
jgi:hypothetical protein